MSHADETESDGRGIPAVGPLFGLFALYLLTVAGGVYLSQPFEAAGVETFENPQDVANVGLIFVEILVFTGLFILIVRYDVGQRILRALLLAVFGFAIAVALQGAFPNLPRIGLISLAAGVLTWLVLWFYPEWYVIDAAAVMAGAAIIALLGNGLGPLPVLLFLIGMAFYDAYAVYISEHMQKIGGGASEMRLPMMYVIPPSLSFSMEDMGDVFAEEEEVDPDETPMLLGLGDAIVPGLLAVSAGRFLDAPALISGTILNAPALGALVGSIFGLIGLLVLLYVVERAHAGLPVLNTCVILGYLGGAVYAGIPVSAALGL